MASRYVPKTLEVWSEPFAVIREAALNRTRSSSNRCLKQARARNAEHQIHILVSDSATKQHVWKPKHVHGPKTPWWSMMTPAVLVWTALENDVLAKLLNYINCWFRTWLHRFFPASAWSWNWIYCPMSVCSAVLSRHAGPPVSSRQDAIFIV